MKKRVHKKGNPKTPVAQRDRSLDELRRLRQEVGQRNRRIEELEHAIALKEADVQHLAVSSAQFSYRLDCLRRVPGWLLLWGLQKGLSFFRPGRKKLGLVPFHQLRLEGSEWHSTGGSPQFLLVADRAWHGLTGWAWLDLVCYAEKPLSAALYFDAGDGFDADRVIRFRLTGQGAQRVPVFIPHQCHAVRFDPCQGPAGFKITKARLVSLKKPPELAGEYLLQASQYEALGAVKGNVAGLNPNHELRRHDGSEFCWQSVGEDPWFLVEGVGRLQPGWCRLELRIRCDVDFGNARIYFDYGEGFNEADSVPLPFCHDEPLVRVFHVRTTPKKIRLDPFDSLARFSIEELSLVNVSQVEAQESILLRLSTHNADFRGQEINWIRDSLRQDAQDSAMELMDLLVSRYLETFRTNGLQDAVSYDDWMARNETTDISITQNPGEEGVRPTISILMPVYNPPETFLRQAIDSVVNQSYPNWELCIADDASPAAHVRQVLEEYRESDARIKVVFRESNGHISAASNSALSLTTGDYVALLDHDDELAEHALHFVVEALCQNPGAQILYSDEDKIDEEGRRSEPHFKPDWNPELLLSQNYISHLGVYRRDLLYTIEGFRLGVEGSQDHDLLLRCLPHVKDNEIVHVPRVLYHWRKIEGSTALLGAEKDYASAAGIKAVSDYFLSRGEGDVQIESGLAPNTYRVRYPLPASPPLVSLLIPTRDGLELLEPCVRSILKKTTYENYEIIILDNESQKSETLEFLEDIQSEDGRVRVCSYPHPFNFSAINNFGVRQAAGDVVGLINNDIEVISPDWLSEMVSHVSRRGIGCVGAKLYYEDNTLQHGGVILSVGGVAGHSHKYAPRWASGYFSRLKVVQNLSAVTAACLLVRKEVYEQVDGLDEDLSVAFNDVDFCLKVREAGYRNLWTPYAELYHFESKTRGAEDSPEKVERFNGEVDYIKSKWGELLKADPFYSRNLTDEREDFSLRV